MKGTILGGGELLNIICVFWFSLQHLFETFLMIIQRDIIISVHTTSCNWSTHCFCKILVKLNFLNRFSKNAQISNFVKITPMGTWLFPQSRQTDRWTNMTQLIVAVAVLRARLKRTYYFARLYEYESCQTQCMKYGFDTVRKPDAMENILKRRLRLLVCTVYLMLWKWFNWRTLVIM